MQLKVLIKTPKGYAKSTEGKLRPFLLGRSKLHRIMTSKGDDKILWIVECKGNDYSRIIKNVSSYHALIKGVLSSRIVRGVARLTKDQEKELDSMLFQQTEIDIVKENEMQELMKEFD